MRTRTAVTVVAVGVLVSGALVGCSAPASPDAAGTSPPGAGARTTVPAVPATSTASTARAAEPSARPCAEATTRVVFGLQNRNPAKGLLTVVNEGSSPCTLSGWPAVSFVDPTGRTLRTAVRGREIAQQTVEVEPGGQAYAYLSFTSSVEPDGTRVGCRSTSSSSYGFDVALPDQSVVRRVPNPDLFLCTDDEQSLVIWRFMPTLETLSAG